MEFELLGSITNVETIAAGREIRELPQLIRLYGFGGWRKCKGFARVRLWDGSIWSAEVHWYEAHGIGKRKMKIKRLVE